MKDPQGQTDIRYGWLRGHDWTVERQELEQIRSLLEQLTGKPSALEYEDLIRVVRAEETEIVAAFHEEGETHRLIGMTTLIHVVKLGGSSGRVEDVIVDGAFRGMGIGRELMRLVIERAKERGLHHLDLTSRPTREQANKLYPSMGFALQETNVYRLKI